MRPPDLEQRAREWGRGRRLRLALNSGAIGLLTATAFVRWSAPGAAIGGFLAAVTAWFLLNRRAAPITAAAVAAHLDRICPTLEESASLWLRDPATLTLVERLQLNRLNAAWAALPDHSRVGRPSVRALRVPGAVALAALLAMVAVASLPRTGPRESLPTSVLPLAPSAPERIALRTASLLIEPPSYLGRPAQRSEALDAEAPEGAHVTWELAFTGPIQSFALVQAEREINAARDDLGGGRFRARAAIASTVVYQVETISVTGARVRLPQIHVLKVIRDLPPRVTWIEPAIARTVIPPGGAPAAQVQLGVNDDHGVAAVELVATLAKGSGEGVKFRERTLTLERRPAGPDGVTPFSTTLDLTALGLEPGDELYVHALARDHREPAANVTRSETRFFVRPGPTATLADPAVVTAGVKRIPQFFRSQRQLIIDTEQLLADQPKLVPGQFEQRSDEIGIDQKLLRLRYGQFLGEEFESPTAGAPPEADAMGFAARLRRGERDAAQRDVAIARALEAQHDHPGPAAEERRPATVDAMAAAYVHRHDSPEAATLFDPKVKSTLRAVLAAMWEAEGFLRGGRPAEALPAENRALELLKELQQADRVYVGRTGFEPPPLQLEQRRLRGELEAIPPQVKVTLPTDPPDPVVAVIREVLARPGNWAELTPAQAKAIEDLLIRAAEEQPEIHVAALQTWRRRTGELPALERQRLRQTLLSLLPPAQPRPERPPVPGAGVGRAYLDQLSRAAEEPAR